MNIKAGVFFGCKLAVILVFLPGCQPALKAELQTPPREQIALARDKQPSSYPGTAPSISGINLRTLKIGSTDIFLGGSHRVPAARNNVHDMNAAEPESVPESATVRAHLTLQSAT